MDSDDRIFRIQALITEFEAMVAALPVPASTPFLHRGMAMQFVRNANARRLHRDTGEFKQRATALFQNVRRELTALESDIETEVETALDEQRHEDIEKEK